MKVLELPFYDTLTCLSLGRIIGWVWCLGLRVCESTVSLIVILKIKRGNPQMRAASLYA